MSEEKIKLILMHDILMIWNKHDWGFIERHRILATPVGPLPNFVKEQGKFGLPIRVMKVQAKLLQEKGLADIVELPSVENSDISDELKNKYKEKEECINRIHGEMTYDKRKSEIIDNAEKILEGKKKKMQSSGSVVLRSEADLTLENVIEEQLSKISLRSEFVELNVEHPFISNIELKLVDWKFPETEFDELHYRIFKDLWEKGYFVTCGVKFGGDYLVYQGHPNSYHASYIVKCIFDDEEMSPLDLIASIRLGTITKKTLLTASLSHEKVVKYQSFQWAGEDLLKDKL